LLNIQHDAGRGAASGCGLVVLVRKALKARRLATQVLCRQCKVNQYPICQTTVPVLLMFFHQRFQSTKTPGFV